MDEARLILCRLDILYERELHFSTKLEELRSNMVLNPFYGPFSQDTLSRHDHKQRLPKTPHMTSS